MTAAHAYELPPDPGRDVVLPAEEFEAVEAGEVVILTRGGRPTARLVPIDPDQSWFWTPEWQAMEREVDESRAAGVQGRIFWSDEEFLDALGRAIDDPTALT